MISPQTHPFPRGLTPPSPARCSIQQIECCLEKMQLIYKQFKKTRTCLRECWGRGHEAGMSLHCPCGKTDDFGLLGLAVTSWNHQTTERFGLEGTLQIICFCALTVAPGAEPGKSPSAASVCCEIAHLLGCQQENVW